MSEATHTPGPWSFEAENGRSHPRVYGHNNSLIAEVGNAIFVRWEEWDANARLIAAAPDMLAALHEVESFLDNQADADHGRPNDAMRHLIEVRAAIVKAQGRTP